MMVEQVVIGTVTLTERDAAVLRSAAQEVWRDQEVWSEPPTPDSGQVFDDWVAAMAFVREFRDVEADETVTIGEDDYELMWSIVRNQLRYAEGARVRAIVGREEIASALASGGALAGTALATRSAGVAEYEAQQYRAETDAAVLRALLIRASVQGHVGGDPR